ncbi:hypothetical protein HK096_004962, partial [Nowakowskiella sp. JEL0078]
MADETKRETAPCTTSARATERSMGLKSKLVWLCRHGEAEHNVKGNFNIRDPLLTEKGVRQASTLLPLLKTLARDPSVFSLIHSVLSSPVSPHSEPAPITGGDASLDANLPVQLVLISPMRRTIQTSAFIFADSLRFAANSKSREVYTDKWNPKSHDSAKISESAKKNLKLPEELVNAIHHLEISSEPRKVEIPKFDSQYLRKATVPAYLVPDLQEVSNLNCDTGSPYSILQNEFPFLTNPLLAEDWYTFGKRKRDSLPQNLEERVRRVKKLIWESEAQSVFIVSHGGFLAAFVDGAWGMVAGW